ncbi:MAG: thioredoxin reductase [Parcubacteria group bacterium]|nr:MAG: thioredoxin reductase [Parcubacteria group bacterium]
MPDKQYDVVVVGGGPAGLSAAIYTCRRALKTIIVSRDVGGQAAMTDEIENYPGFESVGGMELTEKFKKQAMNFGSDWLFAEVVGLKKRENIFQVELGDKSIIEAKAVILAFGLSPRNLEVPGEKELTGKGVSYCATCDGPLYKNKNVVVIGGGNAALDAAEYLSKVAQKVYMILRGDKFRGEQILVDQVRAAGNVEIIFNATTSVIKGEKRVEALVYKTNNDQEKEIAVSGIFIEIGHIANTRWLEGVVELNDRKEVIISRDCESSLPGVFAAGDISEITYKQVVISAGEGAKAALQAYRYLQGNKPVLPDWTPKKIRS